MIVKHRDLQSRFDVAFLDLLVCRWIGIAVDRQRDNWTYGLEVVGGVLISRLHIDPLTGPSPTHFQVPGQRAWALTPQVMYDPWDVRQWLYSKLSGYLFDPALRTDSYTWISVRGWGHMLVLDLVTPERVSFSLGFSPRLRDR